MADGTTLGIAAAFAAGMVSFMSPCVLPLVPAYLSYIGAHKRPDAPEPHDRAAALAMSSLFVAGFGTVFLALGTFASIAGTALQRYRNEASMVAGVAIVGFGLLTVGVLGRVPLLQRDLRLRIEPHAGHPASAFAMGAAFGFGWTPCIGPILGTILTLGAMQGSMRQSMALLLAYAIGLGVPFVLSAMFVRNFLGRAKRLRRAGGALRVGAGLVMIAFGVAILTGKLTAASYWLLDSFPVLGRLG